MSLKRGIEHELPSLDDGRSLAVVNHGEREQLNAGNNGPSAAADLKTKRDPSALPGRQQEFDSSGSLGLAPYRSPSSDPAASDRGPQ